LNGGYCRVAVGDAWPTKRYGDSRLVILSTIANEWIHVPVPRTQRGTVAARSHSPGRVSVRDGVRAYGCLQVPVNVKIERTRLGDHVETWIGPDLVKQRL
jgi:hypothetical protein